MEEDLGEDEHIIAGLTDRAAAGPTNLPASNEMPITAAQLAKREAAVRSLPRRDREIYLAHRLDDMSYAAIARATGLSEKQVEQAMARAIIGIDHHLHGARPRRWWWSF